MILRSLPVGLAVVAFAARGAAETASVPAAPDADPTGFEYDAARAAVAAPLAEPKTTIVRSRRAESLRTENAIDGATGLLRLYGADSGEPGTFRLSLLSSYFAGSGFLCPPCVDRGTTHAADTDDAARFAGHVGLSATPFDFLEAYAAVHMSSTSNSLGSPRVLETLGDTDLGVKVFTPRTARSMWSAGVATEAWFLNGADTVGVSSLGVAVRGLVTADFTNGTAGGLRAPARAYFNLGYLFDDSGKLVEQIETDRRAKISRIERFGLGINRLDALRTGVGAEGVLGSVRPFAEWTIDLPLNRQGYTCEAAKTAPGDDCLGVSGGFSAIPSRVTFGGRVYPGLEGLGFLLAADIGTGATSHFVEELTPELPWNLYVGVAYGVDTEPRVEIQRVEVPRAVAVERPRDHVEGLVIAKGSGAPIAGAKVAFAGRDLTGMITTKAGTFQTVDLEPGTYAFEVSATGYRPAECAAMIPIRNATGAAHGAPTSSTSAQGSTATLVTCELESLPKVGIVEGVVRDAASNAAIGGATATISDEHDHTLSTTTDPTGSFRVDNVPAGVVTVSVEAPKYLRSAAEIEIEPQGEATLQIALNVRPPKPSFVATDKELVPKKPIRFAEGSSAVLPESVPTLEEMAEFLRAHPEIAAVEIRVPMEPEPAAQHTGGTDAGDWKRVSTELRGRLSAARANAVRDALVLHGVGRDRLSAQGDGAPTPGTPSSGRERDVRFMIRRQSP